MTPEDFEKLKNENKKNTIINHVSPNEILDRTFTELHDFVDYLKRRNRRKTAMFKEHFFDQSQRPELQEQVIKEIEWEYRPN